MISLLQRCQLGAAVGSVSRSKTRAIETQTFEVVPISTSRGARRLDDHPYLKIVNPPPFWFTFLPHVRNDVPHHRAGPFIPVRCCERCSE